jgi:hypothetical protein
MTDFKIMWTKTVNNMVNAINSDNNIKEFLFSFEPNESEGYSWTRNERYKRISNTLDDKTGRVHSGASFACCIREALDICRKAQEGLVIEE